MNVTILAKCERCQKQFVFDCGSHQVPIPASQKRFEPFTDNQKLRRKPYVTTIVIDREYGRVETKHGEIVTFCQECDRQYWENFADAVEKLESFWHDERTAGGE